MKHVALNLRVAHPLLSMQGRTLAGRSALDKSEGDEPCFCVHCGGEIGARNDAAIKRGAVVIIQDPIRVFWNEKEISLSFAESIILLTVARRGRATFEQIDEALLRDGLKPANRSVLVWRLRRKFEAIGARDPLGKLPMGYRFVPEPDMAESVSTLIGLSA